MTNIKGGIITSTPMFTALEMITNITSNKTYGITTFQNLANPDFWATVMKWDLVWMHFGCQSIINVIDKVSEGYGEMKW